MSGTSADGVDAALVNFTHAPTLEATQFTPYPTALKTAITELYTPGNNEIDRMGALDKQLGAFYSVCVQTLLAQHNTRADTVTAIGCHGQTIRHRPEHSEPFTVQIGCPNTVAHRTGITTIGDFRRRDMSAGGQGAPLAPAFHQAIAPAGVSCGILNLGGIANISCIAPGHPLIGFDTGPANGLMDAWVHRHQGHQYDHQGAWASSGTPIMPLLEAWLGHPYFKKPPPKSTGREVFSLPWLLASLKAYTNAPLPPEDVQATLLALTVKSVAQAISLHLPAHCTVYACGGGVKNTALMKALKAELEHYALDTTQTLGVHPDWVEAMAFAWLAKQTLEGVPGNVPSVTGAEKPVILGAIYPV